MRHIDPVRKPLLFALLVVLVFQPVFIHARSGSGTDSISPHTGGTLVGTLSPNEPSQSLNNETSNVLSHFSLSMQGVRIRGEELLAYSRSNYVTFDASEDLDFQDGNDKTHILLMTLDANTTDGAEATYSGEYYWVINVTPIEASGESRLYIRNDDNDEVVSENCVENSAISMTVPTFTLEDTSGPTHWYVAVSGDCKFKFTSAQLYRTGQESEL